ncbi:MAG: methionyl-tRNA formyltransferase [Flavobacteriaceae bacterium]|nr:methionyl-tRNA formyltransferase [Flavobacteriaceae bacterium]
MKSLRIVFMGTPDFAVASLDALYNSSHQVVGVITAPDRPAGRGKKIHASPVKEYADKQQLPLLQPTLLKEQTFLTELKNLKADIYVVVAFRMLPKQVWEIPPMGTFNLHASLLPMYRGAAPIHWAVINGEQTTGVTTFFIDKKIDTGAILLQEKTTISKTESTGELYIRLQALGSKLVVKTVDQLALGTLSSQKQKESHRLSVAPKLTKENTRIDWSASAETIFNFIRGLSPYPSAWTTLHINEQAYFLKIYASTFKLASHNYTNGTVGIEDNQFKVWTFDGYILVNELQLAGKKKMAAKDLLNGFKIAEGSILR